MSAAPRTAGKEIVYTPEFLAFWQFYPLKKGKDGALYAYLRARKRATAEDILAGLLRYEFRSDPHFQPHATTFLNRGYWIVEANTPPPTVAKERNGRRHEAAELAEDLGLDLITPIAEQFHDSQPGHPANHTLADQTGSADVRRADAGDKAADRRLCGDLFD